jgi:hypothetical protein
MDLLPEDAQAAEGPPGDASSGAVEPDGGEISSPGSDSRAAAAAGAGVDSESDAGSESESEEERAGVGDPQGQPTGAAKKHKKVRLQFCVQVVG